MRQRQIKLTESKILETINDVLTDYENGEDGLYGSAREAIKNNTGFERWFSTKALPVGIDKEEALNLYTNAKHDLESLKNQRQNYDNTDKYFMDDSRFDEIINETLSRFFSKH